MKHNNSTNQNYKKKENMPIDYNARFHDVFTTVIVKPIENSMKVYRPKYMISCKEDVLRRKMIENNHVSVREVMIPLSDKERGMFFWGIINENDYVVYTHKSVIKRVLSELDKFSNASYYFINGKKCHSSTQEKYCRYLHDCSGALVLVKARDCRTKKASFYLIGDEEFEINHKKNFYPYTEEKAREILAGSNIYERNSIFHFGKRRFEVVKMWYANKEARRKIDNLLPEEVFIVSKDIYLNELQHFNDCHILLYSSFYEKYEYIEAKVGDVDGVWISQDIYDAFVKKQRKVLVVADKIEFTPDSDMEKIIKDRDLFSGLASESILKKQGYSVSRDSGLNKEQRQKILANIVDQRLCSKRNTISRLEFYIKCHNSEKDADARKKWAEDISFIRNYRTRNLR